jgi:hypothetical protein
MSGAAPRDASEMAIRRLVEKVNSLLEGEEAAAALVACGQGAVEPLREFLMEGRPSGIYQPRRWAVEALAGLHAKDVLLEYLRRDRPIPDAVARMGEEAVQNAAATALKQWPSEEVCGVLTGILQRRHLAGAVTTLGELGHTEAIPFIVAALEDDVCRATAENALQKMSPSTSRCPACQRVAEAERIAIGQLRRITGHEAEPAQAGLCMVHLAVVLNSETDPDAARRFVLEQASILDRISEDMQTYSLKHDALRRELADDEEWMAHMLGLARLAGDRRLSAA